MRRYFWNWLWLIATGAITAFVIVFCTMDLITVTRDGLEIIGIEPQGEATIYSLDCGSVTLQFTARSYTTFKVGDYMPIFEEFKPSITKAILLSSIFMGVVFIFFLTEVFRVSDRILRARAIKGKYMRGEVVGYDHYIFGFYTVLVEYDGAKYRMKYPLTKKECLKYPKGTTANIWNGGRHRKWVELEEPSAS